MPRRSTQRPLIELANEIASLVNTRWGKLPKNKCIVITCKRDSVSFSFKTDPEYSVEKHEFNTSQMLQNDVEEV